MLRRKRRIITWVVLLIQPIFMSQMLAQKALIRLPADWEAHEALWIGFRSLHSIGQYDPLVLEVIKEVYPHTLVKVLVENVVFFPEGKALFTQNGIDSDRIQVVYNEPAAFWLRDPGPIFAFDHKNDLVTMDFNHISRRNFGPGYYNPVVIKKDKIDYTLGSMVTSRIQKVNVVLEGGAFTTNGNGTMILVESVTLQCNAPLEKKEIEKRLRLGVGIQNVIWLEKGLAEDPLLNSKIVGNYYGRGEGGHADEFVRFVNDSTIFLSWIPEEDTLKHPINAINYGRLKNAYERLANAKDINGNPFRIVKIPHPNIICEEIILTADFFSGDYKPYPDKQIGDTIESVACASYMNYLLTNGLVILPEYWETGDIFEQKEKDEKVAEIFQMYFQDRKIKRINPVSLNFHGGGIHCIYQEQPKSPIIEKKAVL